MLALIESKSVNFFCKLLSSVAAMAAFGSSSNGLLFLRY